MRKILSVAVSLVLLAMIAGPAYATVFASVDITGGTFKYDENDGLTSTAPRLDEPDGYVLLAQGSYDNLVFPNSGLNVKRNYILDVHFNTTLDSSDHTHIINRQLHIAQFGLGPLSLHQIFGILGGIADLGYTGATGNPAMSGTFNVGLEEDLDLGLGLITISGADSGEINSGHIEIRTAVPGPSSISLLLLGLGLLGMGFVVRRRRAL